MPVSSAASWRPLAASPAIVEVRRLAADDAANGDHAGVLARPRQGHGRPAAARRRPRDRDDVDAVALDARASRAAMAPSRSRDVISPLKRATTMPTARRAPLGEPAMTPTPSGRRGADRWRGRLR